VKNTTREIEKKREPEPERERERERKGKIERTRGGERGERNKERE
jgi:hypothetical protein